MIAFRKQREEEAYAYFSRFGEGYADLKSPFVVSQMDIGAFLESSYLTIPHIMPMGLNEDGEYEIKIMMNWKGYSEIDFEAMHFAYEDMEQLKRVYERLKGQEMVLDSISDGVLLGSVYSSEKTGILFTGIPYDDYWQAWIDGERTETIPVLDGAFLAIPVQAGEHKVELRYHNFWIIVGAGISLMATMMFVISYIVEKKTDRKSFFL